MPIIMLTARAEESRLRSGLLPLRLHGGGSGAVLVATAVGLIAAPPLLRLLAAAALLALFLMLVQLQGEIAPDVPAVDADPARIRGVIGNLLANAIRATPGGRTVTAAAGRSEAGVTISIRDTGSGTPEELRPRVFERFVKGAGSQGSGLGLAIARDVVQAHGGTIEISSQVGKGTEVRFTLPLA